LSRSFLLKGLKQYQRSSGIILESLEIFELLRIFRRLCNFFADPAKLLQGLRKFQRPSSGILDLAVVQKRLPKRRSAVNIAVRLKETRHPGVKHRPEKGEVSERF
jgi:hypothetical protein